MSFFLSMLPMLSTFMLAASDDESGLLAVGVILFLAGPIFYSVTYARYRNKGERHYHERETPTEMSNLRAYDTFIRCDKRQSSSTISGANNTRVDGTLAKHR